MKIRSFYYYYPLSFSPATDNGKKKHQTIEAKFLTKNQNPQFWMFVHPKNLMLVI
jgi:hypothetical protein